MTANFSVNIDFDFSSRTREAENEIWLNFNPYEPITEEGKTPKDLNKHDVLTDSQGVQLKVVGFGGAGFFGKDSFSWMWIRFEVLNAKING